MKSFLKNLSSKWPIHPLKLDDVSELQSFLDLFQDFFQLCEGEAGSAENLLSVCPPSKNPDEDKLVLGIYEDKLLIGLIDLIRNYPEDHVWTIGYLLIHPQYRHQGIGRKFIHDLELSLVNLNITKLRCIVQSQNPKALHFWQQNGFTLVKEIKETSVNSTNINFVLEKVYR